MTEPTAAELCFEQFRREFPHVQVWVGEYGMSYRYMSKQVIEGSKELAKKIIEEKQLPLEVSTLMSRVSTMPHLLTITYKETTNEEN